MHIPVPISLRWIRIITMRVEFSDLIVFVVNEEIGILILRNLTHYVNGFFLSTTDSCVTLISFAFHSPPLPFWDYMMVFAHCFYTSFLCNDLDISDKRFFVTACYPFHHQMKRLNYKALKLR